MGRQRRAHEAYTENFGTSAEYAIVGTEMIHGAQLSPIETGSGASGDQGPARTNDRELTFERGGYKHTLRLTYIAEGISQHGLRCERSDDSPSSTRVYSTKRRERRRKRQKEETERRGATKGARGGKEAGNPGSENRARLHAAHGRSRDRAARLRLG